MTTSPRRRTEVMVVAIVVAVVSTVTAVALVVAGGGAAGAFSEEGKTLTTAVASYRVAQTGRATLCMDVGDEDDAASCGSPIVLPDASGRLANGEIITVTELWLGDPGDQTSFVWLVH